jgi:hypothetical protein
VLASFLRENFVVLRHIAARTNNIVQWTEFDHGADSPRWNSVAILAAVFATAGGYTSAAAFSDGFAPPIATATGLALAGPSLAGPAGPARPGTGRADRAGGNEQHA